MLRRLTRQEVQARRLEAVDATTLAQSAKIVEDVRQGGMAEVLAYGAKLGDIQPGTRAILDTRALKAARAKLPAAACGLLERCAERIDQFARAQRACLTPLTVDVPGGQAGHTIAPVKRAGCYAPGGRFPLPTSVLMTAVTARAAGVGEVWVASPKPTLETQAAAAIAGADALLCIGGAQAIAAFAYGASPIPACDAIVGPGNRWVTAAKQLVAGRVAIDMLAGPSELVVLADASADAATVAADLLGQAEHDTDARAILVTDDEALVSAVDSELVAQLGSLPTAATARAALADSFCVVVQDLSEGADVCNILAPEHLEVMVRDVDDVTAQLHHYGALFIGLGAAEVFGDYGIGPNHVLPTGTGARFTGGLSVLNFLRVRTWLRGTPTASMRNDAVGLARMEGLEAHARAALKRR